MKVIAFYLPQYHAIPENDKWWGNGFTEWDNLRKAKPLFKGHQQPKIPLNDNYYNLLDNDIKSWQIKLAKENGIYGFCFYHYWFDGHLLLEKPVDQYLSNENLDLPFCLCWANEAWTKAWVSKHDTVLIEQRYGGKEQWKEHYDYLLPFFKDSRYINNQEKPLLVIYRPNEIEHLNEMLDYWQVLSINDGFKGIDFAYQQIDLDLKSSSDTTRFTYNIEFQPVYAIEDLKKNGQKVTRILKKIDSFFFKILKFSLSSLLLKSVRKHDYDEMWQAVLNHTPKDDKCIPGVFVDWDNTPRRKEKGRVFIGGSPEKFGKYFKQQIVRTRDVYKKDMIFLTAWNEWSEGCYLEPDKRFEDGYLKAIRESLLETKEFPEFTKKTATKV